MTRDIEDLLRESLEVRAQDVRPDPETWSRVQAKVRRRRTFQVALAGVTATAAVLVAVVVVPGLIDRPDVTFEPAPVAPGEPEGPVRGPTVGCGSPAETAAVHTHQENVWALCVNGAVVPTGGTPADDRNPVFTPDGAGVVFDYRDDGSGPFLAYLDLGTGEHHNLGGGELPAVAPDGRFAYVQGTVIVGGQLFSEPEFEIAVEGRVRRLAWDTQDDRLWFETDDGTTWTVPLDGLPLIVPTHETEAGPTTYFSPAVGPDGTIAVLSADANRDTLTLGYLDRAVVAGAEPRFTQVASLIPHVHPEMDGLYLAPAGYVWVEPVSDVSLRWVPAARQSWVVGGDGDMWLVNEDGDMVHLQGDTQALAVNPDADLGADAFEDPIMLDPQSGLPHNVEVTRQRIHAAARARDFGGLHALMAEDFSWSLGGNLDRDEAIEHLRANPELLDVITGLLDRPYGAAGDIYSWPREFTQTDEYLDHRLGISADGVWRYFIAGD